MSSAGRKSSDIWTHTLNFNPRFREDVEYKTWYDDNSEFLRQRACRYKNSDEGEKMDVATADQFFIDIKATKKNLMEAPYHCSNAGPKTVGKRIICGFCFIVSRDQHLMSIYLTHIVNYYIYSP